MLQAELIILTRVVLLLVYLVLTAFHFLTIQPPQPVVKLTIATVQKQSPRTKFWSLPSWRSLESLPMPDFKRIYTTS